MIEREDAVTLPSIRGEVAFNNVKFSYQTKKGEPVINDISFTVAPGTKTAIVGESGSGKSTCLKLLYRFYDVNEGSITVDGNDLRDLTLDSLRKHIGVVPQDTVLFNASIMYNLLYASPSATQNDVYEACKAANVHDRILGFPDGYETMVGERGLKLSGGERQRVRLLNPSLNHIECKWTNVFMSYRSPSPEPFSRMHQSSYLMKLLHPWILTLRDRSKMLLSVSQPAEQPSPLRTFPCRVLVLVFVFTDLFQS